MEPFTTKFFKNIELPLVVEPVKQDLTWEEFLNIVKIHHDFFSKQLLKYGGLLFRHFPILNAKNFSDFIQHLNYGKFINYVGGDSPRKKITEGIYTSTEAPPGIKIPLHNELSYAKNFPKHIYFYCEIPPVEKGETIIADARKIYHEIRSEVKDRFIQNQLRYISCYCDKSILSKIAKGHRSWHDVFETQDVNEVEKKCLENEFELHWGKKGWLKLEHVRPAIHTHPETLEKVWFNQAHLFNFNPRFLGWWRYLATKIIYLKEDTKLHDVTFADRTPIDWEDLYHIYDVLDNNTIAFPWQKGDVLVLDNILAMHGRATFQGKRRVLTAMTG